MSKAYPFIYINHGKPIDIYSFQGEKYLAFCFKEKVDVKIQKAIEKAAPRMIKGTFLWSDTMMLNYSISDEDEIIMYYLKKREGGFDSEMDNKLLMEIFCDFANDIEQWVLKAHELAPLNFFIGLDRVNGSDWDSYSDTKLDEVIGYCKNKGDGCTARERQIITEIVSNLKGSKSYILTSKQKSELNGINC